MATRPRVLILSFTQTIRDPRPLKQIAALKDSYDVTVASYGSSPDPDVEFIELDRSPRSRGLARIPGIFTLLMLVRQYRLHERWDPRNRDALDRLRGQQWDLVLAHDPGSMAVAEHLTSRHGILLDLHEYSPEMAESSMSWRVLLRPYYHWLCRVRVPNAVALTTVSSGIVDRYRKEFGLDTTLVLNATAFHDLRPSEQTSTIRLVHSGVAAPDRRLEILIDAVVATTADVSLDLYVLDSFPGYLDELKKRAGSDPRVRFRDPVEYRDLVPTLNRYDLGVHVIAPTSFNNLWALPNKFFDFIQARLGVIIGPSPAMAEIVDREGIGIVLPTFESTDLARCLETLDRDRVVEWKRAAHGIADSISGESQGRIWRNLVDHLIG